jgi:hypothetical protein
MPIRPFIKTELDSAEIARLNAAYAKALHALGLVDRNDPITDIVARKIVELGTSGVSDPQEIADRTLKALGVG